MTEDSQSSPELSCFVTRPISLPDEVASAHYSGDLRHWDHVEQHLILPALEATGYRHIPTPTRGAGLIHAHIIEAVNGADLVIADFSRLNPNVFFEAGVRTSVNKPLLVIAEKGTDLPFDLAGINTWFYDPRLHAWDIPAMVNELVEHIKSTKTEGNALWTQFGVRLQVEHLVSDNPTDPITAILDQISNDLRELRNAQHVTGRWSYPRLPAASDDDLQRLRTIMQMRQTVLRESLLQAGQPDELVKDVVEMCATLRNNLVMVNPEIRAQALSNIEGLVANSLEPEVKATFEKFADAYLRYAEAHRTANS